MTLTSAGSVAGPTAPLHGIWSRFGAFSGKRGRLRAVNAICLVVLVVSAAIVLLPLFWLAETAFKSPLQAYVMPPKFIFSPTLVNFRDLLQEQSDQFGQDLIHSLVLLAASVSVALVLGTPAGYALSPPSSAEAVPYLWGLSPSILLRP